MQVLPHIILSVEVVALENLGKFTKIANSQNKSGKIKISTCHFLDNNSSFKTVTNKKK